MPKKAIDLTFGPAFRGLNTYKVPNMLDTDEAIRADGVDVSDGTIRGMYGVGNPVATPGATFSQFIHYADGYSATNGWLLDGNPQFACDDTINPDPASKKRWCYFTTKDGAGNATAPKFTDGTANAPAVLGWATPTTPTLASNGSAAPGGSRRFRVTAVKAMSGIDRPTPGVSRSSYYQFAAPWETNPSNYLEISAAQNWQGAVINLPTVAGAYEIRIYATAQGNVTGPYYFYDRVVGPNGGGTYTIAPAGMFATNPYQLEWDVGGGPNAPVYKYDHSPAPNLTVMAESMHSVVAGAGGGSAYVPPASGILFGAVGSTLAWSMLGYPWYWPAGNAIQLDDVIEAIVTDQATAYVVTRSSVYVVTGTDDQSLSIVRTACPFGCLKNSGQAAVITPHGLVYPSSMGIVLFDGVQGRLITDGILSSLGVTGASDWSGVFHDNYYFLAFRLTAFIYIVDMAAFPEIRVTKGPAALSINTIAKSALAIGGNPPGPYVQLNAGGNIVPWQPRRGTSISGATRQAWTWNTGRIDLGMPTNLKRFCRLWAKGSGNFTITAIAGNDANTVVDSQTLTFPTPGDDWLKDTFESVDWLQLSIVSADGTGVLNGVRVETEVYGAA